MLLELSTKLEATRVETAALWKQYKGIVALVGRFLDALGFL